MEHTYAGAESGVGARMSWTGNRKAGAGSMEITDATESTLSIDLHFLKPFKAQNITTFTATPTEGGGSIEWAMEGEQNLVMKILGLLPLDRPLATCERHGRRMRQ